ncbi:carbohydrate ABC transporter permease [Arthrobacter sp. E3]|uniref:ABC transporter permease subunit n=1 Tax=Arthrobacter sp. E3 TaxID=517402 RepID=UPI001A946B79
MNKVITQPPLPTESVSAPGPSRPRMRRRSSRKDRISPGGYVGRTVAWLLVAFNLFLLVWMAVTSLRDTRDIVRDPLGVPAVPFVENFTNAWNTGGFGTAAINSVIATLVSSLLVVAISAPAAYVLAKSTRKLSSTFTLLFVLGLGVPGQVLLVPVYIMMAKFQDISHLQMLNSIQGLVLVLVGLGIPFTVFLLAGFFRSLPVEIEEAAAIDGSSGIRTFIQIVLPLARSGLVTAFMLAVITGWNETLFSLVLLTTSENRTLPIALLAFLDQAQFNGADWGGLFAGIVMVVTPVLALFIWLGRRIVEGMTVGISK